MIVQAMPDGRITLVINDPVDPEVERHYLQKGAISTPPDASVDPIRDMIADGVIVPRPACPATVTVSGRTVTLAGVPDGSAVSAEIEGESVPVAGAAIALDEAGPLTIVITPPWPYLEARHDLDLE